MKEIKIQEKKNETGVTVDLIVDNMLVETGDNPISSFSFWHDLEQEVQRAIYRIKTKNTKLSFDFNLSTMGLSEEEKEKRFADYAKSKRPDVDVDKVLELFKTEVGKIQLTGQDDNHPNPYMKSPIDSDLVKHILINVIGNYNQLKENK